MKLGSVVLIDEEGKVTEGTVVIEDGAVAWVRIGNHYTQTTKGKDKGRSLRSLTRTCRVRG